MRRPKVEAITSAEYPTRARRPANSALDSTKFTGTFGIEVPAWQDALARVLDTIKAGQTRPQTVSGLGRPDAAAHLDSLRRPLALT